MNMQFSTEEVLTPLLEGGYIQKFLARHRMITALCIIPPMLCGLSRTRYMYKLFPDSDSESMKDGESKKSFQEGKSILSDEGVVGYRSTNDDTESEAEAPGSC